MSVEVCEIELNHRRDFAEWCDLTQKIYRIDSGYVPRPKAWERQVFQRLNPLMARCCPSFFVTRRGQATCARACCFVHPAEEAKLGYKRARFGWFESLPDEEAVQALLGQVIKWGQAHACRELAGPLGFSDLDPQGVLIAGFDEAAPLNGPYNPAYYPAYLERAGLSKLVDYVEYEIKLDANSMPFLGMLKQRMGARRRFSVRSCQSQRELRDLIPALWAIFERCYAPLFGVLPLSTQEQLYFAEHHLSMLDPEMVILGYDQAELCGFFIAMPDITEALRRAGGRLLPLGWWYLWQAFRRPKTAELVLAAILPEKQRGPIAALGLERMLEVFRRKGIRRFQTNRELETNSTVTETWKRMNSRLHRRLRVYGLELAGTNESRAGE